MSEIKVLDKGFVRLVDHLGSDEAIVRAARVSYGKGTRKISEDETLIRYLMRNQHTSPFEMCEVVFHIKLPIFVMRQMVRHRTANLNEISGRYSVLPDECYIPENDKVTFQNPSNKQGGTSEAVTPVNIKNPQDWWDCVEPEDLIGTWNWQHYFEEDQKIIRQSYERYVDSGMRRELARINLPVSQYTECYWKMDLRNLFHFLKLRLDSHAQYEIRVYAEAIFEIIKPLFPTSCQAFEDYILNAITLTQRDIKCLSKLIALKDKQYLIDEFFTNKREREEFIEKLGKLLGA